VLVTEVLPAAPGQMTGNLDPLHTERASSQLGNAGKVVGGVG
jgi:hypothetical protein